MTFAELYEVAFNPANTVLTILLILSVVYWLFTMLSGVGDFDLDLDIHSDGEIEINNPDGTIEVPQDPSAFLQFLKFLNLDIIPITFFLTLVLLFTWLINVNISYFIPLPYWLYFITILPAFVISLFITKYVSMPLRPIFKEINHKGEEVYDFLGRTATLKSTIKDDKLGMIELIISNDPIKLLAKSKDGYEIKDGEKVMIIDEHPERKYYIVEKHYEL
jgi:membrane protein implicated in regulation of membrane protease activity